MKIIPLIIFSLILLGVAPEFIYVDCPYCIFGLNIMTLSAHPPNVDTPITWTITTTDEPSPYQIIGDSLIKIYVPCESKGTKEITVTAENDYGSVTEHGTYVCGPIEPPPPELDNVIFFPIVDRLPNQPTNEP